MTPDRDGQRSEAPSGASAGRERDRLEELRRRLEQLERRLEHQDVRQVIMEVRRDLALLERKLELLVDFLGEEARPIKEGKPPETEG